MKKHSYRQTDVKKIDWLLVGKQALGQEIVFAVDVAKQDFVGVFLNKKTHEALHCIKWKHPQETCFLVEHLASLGTSTLDVVFEPSGTYGDVLAWQCRSYGMAVYRVSPKMVHDMAEYFDGVPSLHDAKAAQIIGEVHCRGRSTLFEEADEKRRDLKSLSFELAIHQRIHQGNLNRLYALLARHWPELEYAADISLVSVLHILSSYGDPLTVRQNNNEVEALLLKIGGHFLSAEKRLAILGSSKHSLGVPCSRGERACIQALAHDLLRTHQVCQEIEKRMKHCVQADEMLSNTAGFCGTVTTATLGAVLGNLQDYSCPGALLKALGLNLKERSSGTHKGQLKITKRGSGRARYYLYWLAMRLVHQDHAVRKWYECKVARDGGRFRGRALIAVMRKLVKALWHVARGDQFDSAKLFAQG